MPEGTYARTKAIDRLLQDFFDATPKARKQIISLGAGSDTRYFRLSKYRPADVLYHELDFSENTEKKVGMIRRSPSAQALLGDSDTVTWTNSEIHAADYHLHAIDLRMLNDDTSLSDHTIAGIDPELPTLLLSECCLTYLKPEAADAVVKHFAFRSLKPSTPLGLALYEPINPFDSFGKVMVSNLASRGIVLQTLHKYSSLEAQVARLQAAGLTSGQRAVDVDFLLQHWFDDKEKTRVSQVEMLDEVEELKLLTKHYCVAWGWRDGAPGTAIWDAWKALPHQQPP